MLLRVLDIVDTHVTQLAPEEGFVEVVARMAKERIEAVVVVSEARPIGILTERDVVRLSRALLSHELDEAVAVEQVMSKPPWTIGMDATVEEALLFCDQHRVRHAVVVDKAGNLAGLLTQGALLRAHAQLLTKERDSLGTAIERETRKLKRQTQQLDALAHHDPLTQVGNRRALDEELEALEHSRRSEPCSLLMLDLDWFKAFNDRYGHLAGDEALRKVATTLRDALRAPDKVFRYGGEEFVVLLHHADAQGAKATAERLIDAVSSLGLEHAASRYGVMTLSAGATQVHDHRPMRQCLELADQALYAAKQAGRNRVAVK